MMPFIKWVQHNNGGANHSNDSSMAINNGANNIIRRIDRRNNKYAGVGSPGPVVMGGDRRSGVQIPVLYTLYTGWTLSYIDLL